MRKIPDILDYDSVRELQELVRQRDQGKCVICGRRGAHVHELLQKSSGAKNSARVFQMKYMACVCGDHHIIGIHSGDAAGRRYLTARILNVLRTRHGYSYPRRVIMFINRWKGRQ
jgi:hypothetical protein